MCNFSTLVSCSPSTDCKQEKWEQCESDVLLRMALTCPRLVCHVSKVSISSRPVPTALCATVDTSHRDWVPQLPHSSKWSVCLLEGLATAGNSHIVEWGQTSARLDSHKAWAHHLMHLMSQVLSHLEIDWIIVGPFLVGVLTTTWFLTKLIVPPLGPCTLITG